MNKDNIEITHVAKLKKIKLPKLPVAERINVNNTGKISILFKSRSKPEI